VGMSKVNSIDELKKAVDLAFQYDSQILIEHFIKGREITCGVFKTKGDLVVLPITEVVSKKEFFDYEAKYTDGMADEITPAPIPEEVADNCRRTSAMLYTNLNCKGVVRFDYIFNDNGMYFLEVNTIPGQSENSIVPKQARTMGLSITDLYTLLLNEMFE
jgi:D-alanine-D-alanine ligase